MRSALALICALALITASLPVTAMREMPETAQMESTRTRIIRFGGHRWVVKKGDNLPPANNNWSDDPRFVWIGTDGKLHLEIRNLDGVWYSAQVTSQDFAHYGLHRFYVESPLNDLDANVVLGLFLYADDYNEIDIEFRREARSSHNAQFVIQPYTLPGNRHTFSLTYTGPTIHEIDWQPDHILFRTIAGDGPTSGAILQEWRYEGESVPADDKQLRIKMNLWLRNPDNQTKPVHVIISDLETVYCSNPRLPSASN